MAEVFRLDDLDTLTGTSTRLAVLGHPVAHSLSPQMHHAALAEMARTHPALAHWSYVRFEVAPEHLRLALPRFHAAGFKGLNLTLPHKVDAVGLVYDLDPVAKVMGAVNTLEWRPEGYYGHNTDGYGIERAVEESLGITFREADIVLLGAGGAARAIATQCLQSGCRRLWLGNRNAERLQQLANRLTQALPTAAERLQPFALGEETYPVFTEGALVINATSLGLKVDDPAPIAPQALPKAARIYDTTYGVPGNGLRRAAEAQGLAYANGLGMLVWQGVRALEIWTGLPVPADAMAQAARRAMAARV